MILVITVLAPVCEELLLRGFAYRALRDGIARRTRLGLGISVSMIVSGLAFIALHGGSFSSSLGLMYFILAVLCAAAYEVSGSLYAAILVHALNNAIVTTVGLTKAGGVRPAADWITWLAAAGPVLSMLLAALIGALIAVLLRSRRQNPVPHLP